MKLFGVWKSVGAQIPERGFNARVLSLIRPHELARDPIKDVLLQHPNDYFIFPNGTGTLTLIRSKEHLFDSAKFGPWLLLSRFRSSITMVTVDRWASTQFPIKFWYVLSRSGAVTAVSPLETLLPPMAAY